MFVVKKLVEREREMVTNQEVWLYLEVSLGDNK